MKNAYTVKELADFLGYSTNTIYTLIKEKKIVSVRLGKGRIKIPKEEIEQLLSGGGNYSPEGKNIFREKSKGLPPFIGISAMSSVESSGANFPRSDNRREQPVGGPATVNLPNLYEWFLGISSIILGFSLTLFSSSFQSQSIEPLLYWKDTICVLFITAGVGLLLCDVYAELQKVWKIVFYVILFCSYLFLALIYFFSQDIGTAVLYAVLLLSIVVKSLIKGRDVFLMLFFVSLLTVLVPSSIIFFTDNSSLPDTYSFFGQYKMPLVFLWLTFSFTSVVLLMLGYVKKNYLLWIVCGLMGMAILATGMWYTTSAYWERGVFLIILAYHIFLAPVWRTYDFFKTKDRQTFLTFFIYILFLFLFLIASIKYFEMQTLIRANNQLINKVKYLQILTQQTLQESKFIVESLSHNTLLVEGVKTKPDNLMPILKSVFESSDNFNNLVIASPSGEIVAIYPINKSILGQNIGGREHIKEVLQTGKTTYSELFIGLSKNPTLALATPILTNNKIISVLTASINFSTLKNKLAELASDSLSETIFVLDKKRQVFIDTSFGNKVFANDYKNDFTKLTETSGQKTMYLLGIKSLVVFDTVSPSGWKIIISQPASSALSIVRSVSGIIVGLISFINAFLVLYYLRTRLKEERKV